MRIKTGVSARIALFMFSLLFLTSCMTTYDYSNLPVPIEYGAANYGDLDDYQKLVFLTEEEEYSRTTAENIIEHAIRRGYTKQQVLYSWGRPDDYSQSSGGDDMWVYDRGSNGHQYLFFEDGRLRDWRDTSY